MSSRPANAVAIVGMAARFPGAADLAAYWHNVCAGVDAITEVPPHRADPVFFTAASAGSGERFYCRRGGFLAEPLAVDAAALGIMPVAARAAEPEQLLALQAAADALRDAGLSPGDGAGPATGVIIGRGGYLTPAMARLEQRTRTAEQVVSALRDVCPDLGAAQLDQVRAEFARTRLDGGDGAAIGLVPNLTASRIANRLDLRGPAYTVDAACASSLVAIDHAVAELQRGRCDRVIAGGVHVCHDVTFWSVFTQLGALSRDQMLRPFDRRADGLLIGEGVGVVVLERLADAERAGRRIYATIRGVGVASDGRGGGLMKPSVEGQLLALQRGWKEAALDPDRVGYVEAHGTATPVGDAAELETLGRFFGSDGRAGLGSVKSMIGHTMPAAGIAGLINAALAVHHGELPPTLHCEQPVDALAATRFELVRERRVWEGTGPRCAGVNAFGFGGINAHVVLEQHGARAPARRPSLATTPVATDREQLLLLSAESPAALRALLDDPDSGAPAGQPRCRLAIFDPTPARLARAKAIVDRGKPWRGRQDMWFSPHGLAEAGIGPAFVFPGIEASFEPRVDDLAAHFREPPPQVRGQTELERHGTALIGVSRLLDGALRRLRVQPAVIAGHSVGEWAGMIASGMIPAAEVDGFLASLAPGTLAALDVCFVAVGCAAERAHQLVTGLDGVVVSHDNCPHQAIICGPEAAITTAAQRLREARILCQPLPFRSGFHTPLYAPLVDSHRANFARLPLQPAAIPLWSATTCSPYPAEPAAIRRLLADHLIEPVRFRELVEALYAAGTRIFVCAGSSQTLAGFIEDTLRGKPHLAVTANTPKRSGLAQLARVAAALHCEGIAVDFAALPITVTTSRPAPQNETQPTPSPALHQAVDSRDASRRGRAGEGAGTPAMLDRASGRGEGRDSGRGMVTLDLGVPLVRLPEMARNVTVAPARVPSQSAAPVAVQLEATFEEMVAAHQQVLDAWSRAHDAAPAPVEARTTRTLSLDTEPQLADHCFYRQPAAATMAERFPVVPMTMNLELMLEAVRALVPARTPVAIEHVTAYRWLAVEPAATVDIVSRFDGHDRVEVRIGDFASGTVIVGDRYPALGLPAIALDGERPPTRSAKELYADRWMFHGPAYQGVERLDAVSDAGIRGRLRALPASGGLLDNAGQLMGYWVMTHTEVDRLAFPVRIARIDFSGPPPTTGTLLDCSVRIRELTPVLVHADMELCVDGRVWARITDWVDKRFDTDEVVWPMLRFPEQHTLAQPDGEGNCVAVERWRGAASRELIARRYLTTAELVRYEQMGLRARRGWLLGRIAVKDAVRAHAWRRGHGSLFPLDIAVSNDPDGKPRVRAPLLGELHVSLAHKADIAVARVSQLPVGVDVERIESRSEGFAELAFTPAERSLRTGAAADEWQTRIWAAKEAVAKLRGTGLAGNPRRFEVREVAGERLLVAAAPHTSSVWVNTRRRGDHIIAWAPADDGGASVSLSEQLDD